MLVKTLKFAHLNKISMAATIEARKLSIIEYLAEIEDESILVQIENLLKPTTDFWNELSEEDKALIRQGEKELNEGKRIAFSEFLAERRRKP